MENGGFNSLSSFLNLTPVPGLRRGNVRRDRYGVWRCPAAHGVTPGDAHRRRRAAPPHTLKLEFGSPNGSFKDRGMIALVSYLKSWSVDRVIEDSSGLSAFASAAGMHCRVS